MERIQFLIKFGEKKYMKRFADGNIYFSNALRFRELEKILHKKGQGDYLEGASKIHILGMDMYDTDTGDFVGKVGNASVVTNYEPANNIPVFCLFTCYDTNCIKIDETTYQLSLDEDIVQNIITHFDKADTAAVIVNPSAFVDDIQSVFNNTAKTENVHYFHIEGIASEKGMTQDLQYYKYLTQDIPPQKVDGGTKYTFNAKYVYRCLFCKDVFFEKEQEYRILLPEEKIISPQEFYVPLSTPIKLFNMKDILNGKEFHI